MPVSKDVKNARVAAGYCSLCPDSTAVEKKKLAAVNGKPSKFCLRHLKYFRLYRKKWREEHPEPKTQKCGICREVGHTIDKCQTPEAIAFRDEGEGGTHAN